MSKPKVSNFSFRELADQENNASISLQAVRALGKKRKKEGFVFFRKDHSTKKAEDHFGHMFFVGFMDELLLLQFPENHPDALFLLLP